MRVFVIPSWYPTEDHPLAGIFIKEQTSLYAQHFTEDVVGVSLWGSHCDDLLVKSADGLKNLGKIRAVKQNHIARPLQNLTEYFSPAKTWTRRFRQGNIRGIIEANRKNLDQFIAEHGKPDVIHAHIAYPGGYVAQALSERFGIPFLITENMSPFPMEGLTYGFEKYVLEPLKNADLVLAVSSQLEERLQTYGIDAKVFPNFIDDDFFKVKEKKRVETGCLKLVTVGRLESQKGHADLLDACSILAKRIDFSLDVLGGGSLRKELEEKTVELGLDRQVQFYGSADKNLIRKQLQNSDVFVFPSLHESFGIAPLEAIASGLPVVGTDVGVLSQIINEDTGRMAEIGNAESLAREIEFVIRNIKKYDPLKIRKYFDDQFSTEKVLKILRGHYSSLKAPHTKV